VVDDVLGSVGKGTPIYPNDLVGPVELAREELAETPTDAGDQDGSLGGGLGELSRRRRGSLGLLNWFG